MVWMRMFRVAWRLAWPYLLTPWRSPLLRWRMETYGVRDARGALLSAHEINARVFFRFFVTHRLALVRFLRWAASLSDASR